MSRRWIKSLSGADWSKEGKRKKKPTKADNEIDESKYSKQNSDKKGKQVEKVQAVKPKEFEKQELYSKNVSCKSIAKFRSNKKIVTKISNQYDLNYESYDENTEIDGPSTRKREKRQPWRRKINF